MTWTIKEQHAYIRKNRRKCESKTRYASAEDARQSGRRHISKGGVGRLWFYQCQYCQHWHLTSKEIGPHSAVHFEMA
jgi:hypothetical protein